MATELINTYAVSDDTIALARYNSYDIANNNKEIERKKKSGFIETKKKKRWKDNLIKCKTKSGKAS